MRDDPTDSRLSIRDAIVLFSIVIAAVVFVSDYVGTYNKMLGETDASVRALTRQVENLQGEIQQARCRP